MYANRYGGGRRIDPGSLGVAVAINGAVLAALMLSSPTVTRKLFDPPITTYTVPPIDPPPPPEPIQPKPEQRLAPRERIETTIPTVPTPIPPDTQTYADPTPFPVPTGEVLGTGTGPGVALDPPTPAPPMLIGPSLDGRYAEDFQPGYPAEERRAEREGRVVVRVLIGVDGRVKQVERVSATSDAFFRVTERQAMARWRFKPATRGGIPEEAWYRVALRFELKD